MTNEAITDQREEEGELADAARLEPEITGRTRRVLFNLRLQVSGRTQRQQHLDRFIDLVGKKLAFGLGENRIPYLWGPKRRQMTEDWWTCIIHEVSHLVVLYWAVIREGEWREWEKQVKRLEDMVEGMLVNYLIAPAEPAGFYLLTAAEWKIEKEKRDKRKSRSDRQKDREFRGHA